MKHALFAFLRECPVGTLFVRNRAETKWKPVAPITGYQFTGEAMILKPIGVDGANPVELRFHAAAGRNVQPVVLTDICFVAQANVKAGTVQAEWKPVDYRDLHVWLQGAIANVVAPLDTMPEGAIRWSARLYAHVIATVQPWFHFGPFQRLGGQGGASASFEYELTDWPGANLYVWAGGIAKLWLIEFLDDAGCIGHEDVINALPVY